MLRGIDEDGDGVVDYYWNGQILSWRSSDAGPYAFLSPRGIDGTDSGGNTFFEAYVRINGKLVYVLRVTDPVKTIA